MAAVNELIGFACFMIHDISSNMPKCLCIVTLFTGMPLKKMSGCWISAFFLKA